MSSRHRPRGFASWRPQAAAMVLLRQVECVLTEYAAHLPLTIRQVFYRLVGSVGYPKDETAYVRLCELMNRARRAGMIPFAAIRDDGATFREAPGWKSAAELLGSMRGAAEQFRLDRQAGQPRRLLLAVEAAGMLPQIERIAAPLGVPCYSSGGFDSLTAKYDIAKRLAGWKRAEILHVGDHDPSGVHLFESLAADVTALAGPDADLRFSRVAVTPEQIAAFGLPTSPPKRTDRRSFTGETVQAEAIPPDLLADIVAAALRARIDPGALQAVLERENEIRNWIGSALLPLFDQVYGE